MKSIDFITDIDSKGRVQIPAKLRKIYGYGQGMTVEVTISVVKVLPTSNKEEFDDVEFTAEEKRLLDRLQNTKRSTR